MLAREVKTGRKGPMSLHLKGEGLSLDVDTPALDKCFMLNTVSVLCDSSFPFRLNRNQSIAAHDRLTIYFHAVLSKDFKFNPSEDQIFIEAGRIIGSWKSVAVELSVTRYVHSANPHDFNGKH